MYDFFFILLSVLVFNNLFLQHFINYHLTKKAQQESLNDFYRLMQSTNFDLSYDILKRIETSDQNTKDLFFEFRLYIYDKFKQNLETLQQTDIEEIKQKIQELKQYYEDESKQNA